MKCQFIFSEKQKVQSKLYLTADPRSQLQIPSQPNNWKLVMKSFLWVILPLPLIQEWQLLVTSENMCTSSSLPLRELSLPRKSVNRFKDWFLHYLNSVDWAIKQPRKTIILKVNLQQNQQFLHKLT